MDRLSCDRMFVAIMEAGSFARAAERLGTSSGQASKMVSRLEQELGVRLLNRSTRAISPTEVGRAYFERIRHVLEDIDALNDAVKSRSGAPTGRLRLTVPMSFGVVLSSLLAAFARAYPAIELHVSYNDRVVNLIDEGFDAGVRIGSPADSTLIARRLCDARIVQTASRDFLKANPGLLHPRDLGRCNCILDTNLRDPFAWHFRDPESKEEFSVPVVGRLQFSSPEACLVAAEQGLGVAYGPSFMAGPRLRAGALVRLFPEFEAEPRGIYAIYPPGRHLAAKVRVLVDFLAERFAGQPVWDQGW